MTAADTEPGLLLVDKPAGPTSHDVVGRVRALLHTRRVGHAGTLDPAATGLLVIAVGRATKLLGHVALTAKSYTATIRLGMATDTDDATGTPLGGADPAAITDDELRAAMATLTGEIQQVPSAVSAIKVDGRRAYERVRAGESVELAPRPVTVSRFEIDGAVRRGPGVLDADVTVACSSGTYVRALARDLGARLAVGGHLTALRRTSVGPFEVRDAIDVFPDGLPERGAPRPPIEDALRAAVTDAVQAVDDVIARTFPVRIVTESDAADLRHGRPLTAEGRTGTYACCTAGGALVALVAERDGRARSVLGWQAAG